MHITSHLKLKSACSISMFCVTQEEQTVGGLSVLGSSTYSMAPHLFSPSGLLLLLLFLLINTSDVTNILQVTQNKGLTLVYTIHHHHHRRPTKDSSCCATRRPLFWQQLLPSSALTPWANIPAFRHTRKHDRRHAPWPRVNTLAEGGGGGNATWDSFKDGVSADREETSVPKGSFLLSPLWQGRPGWVVILWRTRH